MVGVKLMPVKVVSRRYDHIETQTLPLGAKAELFDMLKEEDGCIEIRIMFEDKELLSGTKAEIPINHL